MIAIEDARRPLIPQPLRWEGKVQVELPRSLLKLADDVHYDRQVIGLFLACILAVHLFGSIVRWREKR